LKLVRDEQAQRPVLGGQQLGAAADRANGDGGVGRRGGGRRGRAEREAQAEEDSSEIGQLGVEMRLRRRGSRRSACRCSRREKSMTALAFLFAVFLAKPCPFYILDEVEARSTTSTSTASSRCCAATRIAPSSS